MIADLKPYEEYKETGLPWIGRVPAHWLLRRMKALFKERVEKGFPTEPLLAATQSKGVVRKDDYGARTVTAMKDLHLLKLVEKGDFVISLRSFEGGIETAHCRGIISPAYTILTPNSEVRHEYYARYFKSSDFIRSLTLFVTGIREGQNIDYEKLSRADMPIPPPDEQAAIVRFLDWACGRLDRAIRAKRKIIKLLEEQKQVIIHQAVTRGLDPNVKMKPSGISWLGDVPAHWEVSALKRRFSIELGKMLDEKKISGEYHIPYLRNIDVQWDRINSSNLPVMDIAPWEYARYTVQPGDLLVCEGGEVGRAGFWTGALPVCGFQKALHRVRPKDFELDNPRFLYYVLFIVAKMGVFLADGNENTIAHLTGVKLRAHKFAFPDRNEQDTIVSHLDHLLSRIDGRAHKIQNQIDLLREYRTRLIADVVTGKLDVREAAAKLPDKSALATDADGYEDELADAEEPAEDGTIEN